MTTLATALAKLDTTELELPQKVRELLAHAPRAAARAAPRSVATFSARARVVAARCSRSRCESRRAAQLDLDLADHGRGARCAPTRSATASSRDARRSCWSTRTTRATTAPTSRSAAISPTRTARGRHLTPQSLWIPAGDRRTFALVDHDAQAARRPRRRRRSSCAARRPDTAAGARRASTTSTTTASSWCRACWSTTPTGRGTAMVIASFHDARGPADDAPVLDGARCRRRPLRRLQFVGPQGSVRGELYVGDLSY